MMGATFRSVQVLSTAELGQPDSKANPECQPKRKMKWSDLLSALDCLYKELLRFHTDSQRSI